MNGNFSIIPVHQSAALIVLFSIKGSLQVIIVPSVMSALSKHKSDIHFHEMKRDVFERNFLLHTMQVPLDASCQDILKHIFTVHLEKIYLFPTLAALAALQTPRTRTGTAAIPQGKVLHFLSVAQQT